MNWNFIQNGNKKESVELKCSNNKMKILYLANYRNSSGYSEAARNYILSLKSANLNVVPRHINLLASQAKIPQEIEELERQSQVGCNINIQHTLPHLMSFDGRYDKNIAIFACETSSFKDSSWKKYLNLMDEVWVINNSMVSACKQSGVKKPIKVVPHAFNLDKYFSKQNSQIETLKRLKDEGKFLFYTIGEFVRRKNYGALIKAFHSEFANNEPVELVIKTSRTNIDKNELGAEINNFCNGIKNGLKLYSKIEKYKKEIVITENLSEEQIQGIHNTCDCFVQPSYGEAWSIPAFDAMGFGKTPIVSRCTGYLDYIPCDELLVDVQDDIVFGANDSLNDLYTGRETWYHADLIQLRKKMRGLYELSRTNDIKYKELVSKCRERVFDFTYEKVGEIMKKSLNE